MGVVLSVIGIALVVMSLLLLIVYPVAGIIGIAAGIGAFIYGRKYSKQKKTESQQTVDYVNNENERLEEFFVAGFDHYQDELSSLMVTRNDDYRLSNKTFIEDVGERTYEYYPEWYDAELIHEPENEFDSNAISVNVQDMKIGYIARKDQDRLKALDPEKVEAEIYGGNYKEIDYGEYGDECTVVKDATPYKATVYVRSR